MKCFVLTLFFTKQFIQQQKSPDQLLNFRQLKRNSKKKKLLINKIPHLAGNLQFYDTAKCFLFECLIIGY